MKKTVLLIVPLLLIGLSWGQDCTADNGTEGVELWGECYWIENTTEILLPSSGLTGEIPESIGYFINIISLVLYNIQLIGEMPESIGNVTNLSWLNLYNNQLNGEIPVSICNVYQNLEHFYIYNNQFCPPYPECLTGEDIGSQDTANGLGSVTVDHQSDWNLVGLPVEVENPY